MTKKKKKIIRNALVKVTSPIDPHASYFVQAETMDDEQIEKELLGRISEFYVYEFPLEGKVVSGLTSSGVREMIRYINKNTKKTGMRLVLDPDKMKTEETEQDGHKGIRVTAWAKDMISGMFYPGAKFEPYQKYSQKQKKMIVNTFPLEKATSKAIRNAFRGTFPEAVIISMITHWRKHGKVAQISAPTQEAQTITKEVEMKPSTDEQKFEAIMQGIYRIKSKSIAEAWLKKAEVSKELPIKYKNQVISELKRKIKLYKED